MVNDKHGKTKNKKRVQSMAEMDTVESEVNNDAKMMKWMRTTKLN